MNILFVWEGADTTLWEKILRETLGEVEFRAYPETGTLAEIDYVLAWMPPVGFLKTLPDLKAIISIGAGVSHILRDPQLPDGVPIVRLIDEVSVRDMSHHALHWVLHFHRNYDCYARRQTARQWLRQPVIVPGQRRVGILGVGAIGGSIARFLADHDFEVTGWSRSEKTIPGVHTVSGDDGFSEILSSTEILINMLPATEATRNILDISAFAQMPKGGFLINMGRGETVVDQDLIAALDSGQLDGAALDVFREEPLPPDNPLWTHPKVFVTPHAAGATNQMSAPRQIASDILKIEAGIELKHVTDISKGY